MTVGQLMEHTAAFAAAEMGLSHVDASAFSHSCASLVSDLRAQGFRTNARWLRDPFSGQRYPEKIEVGICKYNRLNKFASDKARARAVGKRDAVTQQPVAGKGRGERALRFGTMETTALASHGGSSCLDDAIRERSDGCTARVCGQCGNPHLHARDAPCPLCGGVAVDVRTTTASVRMTQVAESMHVGMNLHAAPPTPAQ